MSEDRWLFEGDFVTCDRCGDAGCGLCDYTPPQPFCSNCGNAGCDLCDDTPAQPFCSSCDDDGGCELCWPERYPPTKNCGDCGRSFEVELLNDGICAECQFFREEDARTYCVACGAEHTDTSLKNGYPCKECNDYYNSLYEVQYDPQPEP